MCAARRTRPPVAWGASKDALCAAGARACSVLRAQKDTFTAKAPSYSLSPGALTQQAGTVQASCRTSTAGAAMVPLPPRGGTPNVMANTSHAAARGPALGRMAHAIHRSWPARVQRRVGLSCA